MVDIHSHLLFGVDDGPETLDESIEMIKKGMELGFSEFYLTSHYGKGRFCNNDYDVNFKILKEKCQNLNLNIKLHRGNEIYLDENISKTLGEKRYNTIEGRYLLVEFSPYTLPSVGKHMIKKVIDMGYIPVVAHVERYNHFRGSDLMELKRLGCKLQVNIGGEKPKHIVRLLKDGNIAFLGSDAHRIKRRGYSLCDLENLRKLIGEKRIGRMTSFTKLAKEEKGNEETQSNSWIFSFFIRNILRGTWVRSDS
ncbi:CpsB/CapC family capsule biosynthesis tyrosine phosphatase [uncultured Cetobacterium sp.]|uniref:tyrosine-protein phosphatase n=1 Tax=uncultured Cetobacterium sp. TaxID=527638 RepID=UPI0026134477|nr:CpsB/CapC family capsule biosynthesis tyrosine phosphatase [uncultured Cetobacterium sp.]